MPGGLAKKFLQDGDLMKTEKKKFSLPEYERAYEAYGDWKMHGKTEMKCLHCGSGHFQFFERGNSVEIRCGTPDCVTTGIRGI
jgi:hypothetical protein